mgnify:CR=1 FL=1
MAEAKPLSRSEREAKIKDKAGWAITVIAALLAVNTYVANGLSSKVLTNTIKASDTYSFYQSKSIKQALTEQSLDDAVAKRDTAKIKDRKSTRLNSSHTDISRMPSSA